MYFLLTLELRTLLIQAKTNATKNCQEQWKALRMTSKFLFMFKLRCMPVYKPFVSMFSTQISFLNLYHSMKKTRKIWTMFDIKKWVWKSILQFCESIYFVVKSKKNCDFASISFIVISFHQISFTCLLYIIVHLFPSWAEIKSTKLK